MSVRIRTLGLAVLVAGVIAGTAEAKLTFHCTFDDSDNPLTPLVGDTPDVVTYSKDADVAKVSGLGGCGLTTDDEVLAGMVSGSGALTIPVGQAVRISHGVPIDTHRPWSMAVRFYLPDDGKKHVVFSNNETKGTDSALFIKPDAVVKGETLAGGGVGTTAATGWGYSRDAKLTPGSWHVMSLSFQSGHIRMYIDAKLVYDKPWLLAESYGGRHTLAGHPYVFLSGDDDGEDNPMPFDWVKIWDEAEPPELLHLRNPVGLWEFSESDPAHATIGSDLEMVATAAGKEMSFESVQGLVPGDGAMRLNQWTAYKIRHGLQNQSYTVVIDAKMPSGVTRPNNYHALWHENGAKHSSGEAKIPDPTIALRSSDGQSPKRIRFWGQSGQNDLVEANGRYFYEDEWVRYVITWDGANRSFYANGSLVFSSTRVSSLSTNFAYLHGDLDGQGEESPLDFTTMALYEGAMSAAEVARLGGPVASQTTAGDSFDAAPVGEWVMREAADGKVPSRIGEDLAVVSGGYAWRHVTSDESQVFRDLVYVLDLDIGPDFAGGAFLETANGTDIRMDAAGRIGNATIGWTYPSAPPSGSVRVIVANAGPSFTEVLVNGELKSLKPLGKLVDASSVLAEAQTFRFLEPAGVTITSAAVYPGAVWPVGASSPSDYDPAVAGEKAQPTLGNVSLSASSIMAGLPVDVTFSCADAARDWYVVEVDFGDGTCAGTGQLRYGGDGYGGGGTYSHVYSQTGSYPVRVRTYDAQHRTSAWTSAGTVVVRDQLASDDVLLTWPWQQNVYTNRFTVMCEAKVAVDGLELQWGADYANTAAMTGVEGNGGTWVYTARVAVSDAVGETIPYRLAASGVALGGTPTTGTVRLWADDPDETFSVAVWGDNQQGTREGDWDADVCLFARRIFAHMAARPFDFGIATGDMSTGANYEKEIRPLDLEVTDGLFGATRPYYVAWGNHDTLSPAVKPYFETGAVDEPGYGESDCGNYHLYRGNVLFAFVDHQLRDAPETVQWLADLLATPRAKAAKFRILVQHFPIFGETGNETCAALLEVVKTGKVDLVLSGHMHGYERIEKDGFVQLTNGGLGCLDHHESPVHDLGDATKVGGHNPLPYLWARQRSFDEPGVLGPAEPVRMGMIQGYGELAVTGDMLVYKAHGFNADGSYVGVFDTVSLTSKTVSAAAPAATAGTPCANPSSFADFVSRPVTNAKWKEFADAVGLPFAYPEGAGECAVTGVSKTEIERFLAWLNGAGGTYRLPTRGELVEVFGGKLARDVSEWTSSVDPATGRCLILGGNTNALAGTWCRAADRPMISTADCTANYLGFRLATGPAPAEPADAFAEALAEIAALPHPAAAYRWTGGTLVDISSEVENPSRGLSYADPVIFTGGGDLTLASDAEVAFRGGLAAPNATSFTKAGAGTLVVGQSLKAGPVTSSEGWILASRGGLRLENVTSTCTGLRFRSGDGKLALVGDNDLASALLPIDVDTVSDFVAAFGKATLRARAMRDYGNRAFLIGKDVTLTLTEDLKCGNSEVTIDGLADMAGFNVVGNLDPWICGSGTLRTTSLGSCQNSYIRLAIANLIFTSASPWRQNAPKYEVPMSERKDRVEIAGSAVRLASLYDWTMPTRDNFGIPRGFMADVTRVKAPHVIFDTLDPDDGVTPHTFVFSPLLTFDSANSAKSEWSFDKTGPGTLVMDCDYRATQPCVVRGGTLRLVEGQDLKTADLGVEAGGALELGGGNDLAKVTFAGGTLRLADGVAFTGEFKGPMILDQPDGASLVMRTGLSFDGAVTLADGTDKARVRRLFEGTCDEGYYSIFKASGLTADKVAVTHDVPDSFTAVTDVTEAGDVTLIVQDGTHRRAVWTGKGDRANPLDPRNWSVTAADGSPVPDGVPDATTRVVISGQTALNVPAGTAFACDGILCSDRVTLTDDCDWRGLGKVTLPANAVVDLNGHRLTLADMACAGAAGAAAITDLTADAEHPGELHVDVPGGVTRENATVRLSGNLRLVKDGAGTFVANLRDQTYRGGTSVATGTFASLESFSFFSCGAYRSVIAVAEDAVFDRKGRSGLGNYRLVLDGGTLTCSYNPTLSDHKGQMGDLELTADSRIVFDAALKNYGAKGEADLTVTNAVWELNGHTLDIVFDGYDPDVYVEKGVTLRNGTVRTTMVENGWFHDRGINGKDGGCLDIATILRLNCGGTYSTISNLTIRTTLNNVTSEGYQKVYGTFTPASRCAYKIELQDGASVNLGELKDTWSLVPQNSTAAAATFADNATIGVDLGDWTVGDWTKVIAWKDTPSNLDTLKFVRAPGAARRFKLRVEKDGVWAKYGWFAIILK